MKSSEIILLGLWLSLGTARAGVGDSAPVPKHVEFNRDIRPIFSDTCFKCHGPDERQRKAKLRLDTKEGAFANREGKFPIVPEHSERSEAYRRMTTSDPDDHMPPLKSNKVLTPRQIETVRRWIDQGAEIQPHWAFIPPTRPELPAVQRKSWPRNGIDYFILARLEAEGLKPSREADKATLIRRLSLDLTGLPPSPAEVEAFLADKSPGAYESVVDRLLASPQYGEKMAMTWLDGARYADSYGYQADFERSTWRWRDWVINAFNQNQPFDQFTIDQIAGDLRPNPTREQRLATGFNRNHRINSEGGIIPEEWRVEGVVDRVETTSGVWLGLTMGCCRCHDHKYDPVSQKEFYKFFAFFNSVNETGAGAEGAANTPPVLKLPSPEQEKKLTELSVSVKELETRLEGPMPELDAAQVAWEQSALAVQPAEWSVLKIEELSTANGSTLTVQEDGSALAGGKIPDKEKYTMTARTGLKGITGFRLEAMTDPSREAKGPGASANGNFILTEFRIEAASPDKTNAAVKLRSAVADFVQDGFDIAKAITGKDKAGGWAIYPETGKPHFAIFEPRTPVGGDGGAMLRFTLDFRSGSVQHQIARFRLSATTSPKPTGSLGLPADLRTNLVVAPEARDASQRKQVQDYFRAKVSPEGKKLNEEMAGLRDSIAELEGAIPNTMVMQDLPKPRETFVLVRGQYDKHGDTVTPGVPASLPPLPEGAPANRLGLAQWIVSPTNPLTARVAVNRYWEKFFGAGLVKSTENLGSQADWPSHPELLDWLAVEFERPSSPARRPWDMKAIQKLIVMSATYRQSSKLAPALLARDPENRLLARGPRFRLPAESIRDNALAVAGLLVEKIGGPPARPYQPAGIWDEVNFYGNLHNYKHQTNGNEYRRGLYTIWKRTTPPPDMTLFDMPGREVCALKRSRTDTPLQALALLNDETYVEASRMLAQRMIEEGGATAESRIAYGFRAALARPPSRAELEILKAGLNRRLAKYRAGPEAASKLVGIGDTKPDAKLPAPELAAYTVAASTILNLDETMTKE
jgi:hypothetical protein